MAFQETKNTTIILGGGLDLVTPPTSVPGGHLLIVKNWIADAAGGYREWDGFERLDGLTSPTEGIFVAVPMDSTANFIVGEPVTQATTGAVGIILQIETEGIYFVAVTGAAFLDTFTITGGTSAATGDAIADGVNNIVVNDTDIINDVRYAKEIYYRDLISAVPGSGPIEGAFRHQASAVAVRANAGATESVIHKISAAGWVAIDLGHIVFFDTVVGIPANGTVISDGVGNTATMERVSLKVTGGLEGYAVLTGFTTGFAIAAIMDFNAGVDTMATVTVAPVANALTVGGRYEWVAHNFAANDGASYLIYAANGVDSAFQLDPVNDIFAPIITDQDSISTDKPSYLVVYRNHLFVGFVAGFFRNSVPGNPFLWDAAVGAQENPSGAPVTGFDSVPQALLIYTRRQTKQLVGVTAQSTSNPFVVTTASAKTGAVAYTAQHITGSFSIDDRGIISVTRVDAFGDFENASISKRIRPLITDFKDDAYSSVVIGRDNIYLVLKRNGEGIAVTFMEDNTVAFAQIDFTKNVECISNGEDETGKERILFGSDDGFVYEALRGRSYDGVAAERWMRPVYHHLGSILVRKRFKRAYFNTIVSGRATIQISAEFGFGSAESRAYSPEASQTFGINSLWDVGLWDVALWDAGIVSNAYVDLKGHGDSVGLIVYHSSATDDLVTLKDVTYQYKMGSLQRGAR